jgi:RNA polymerase sigma factor (sigma-70 family)
MALVTIRSRTRASAAEGTKERFLELLGRLLPGVASWARGRLPRFARRRADTEDLVQDAMVGALVHADALQDAQEPAIRSYLRHSILNRIRDELRRSAIGEIDSVERDHRVDPGPGPDVLIQAREERLLFRMALDRLSPEDQALVVGRVELRLDCEVLAAALGAPSSDAVRVASRRAVLRLGREMGRLEVRRAEVVETEPAPLRTWNGQVSHPS